MQSFKMIKKLIIFMMIMVLLSLPYALSYDTNTHVYITQEAIRVAKSKISARGTISPESFINELKVRENLEALKNASIAEDEQEVQDVGICPGTKQNIKHTYCMHFWTTVNEEASESSRGLKAISEIPLDDGSSYWPSAYSRAVDLYNNAKIAYKKENKAQAYYYLGQVAHLLQDMSVPAHTHNDVHLPLWAVYIVPICSDERGNSEYCGTDSYEEYVKINYINYDWSDSSTPRPKDSRELITLFSLFKNTAEIADDYPSDDVKGETSRNNEAERLNEKYKKLGYFNN